MGIEQKILVSGAGLRAGVATVVAVLLGLTACGQKGNLYLPNDPEFQQRAKLPDIVRRQLPGSPDASPASGPASPSAPAAPSPARAASAAVR